MRGVEESRHVECNKIFGKNQDYKFVGFEGGHNVEERFSNGNSIFSVIFLSKIMSHFDLTEISPRLPPCVDKTLELA